MTAMLRSLPEDFFFQQLSTKLQITVEGLRELRSRGWSQSRIAIHYRVSVKTIKRRFKSFSEEKDVELLSLARELESLGRKVPTGYCRSEIMRLVNTMRTELAQPASVRRQRVEDSIRDGAREVAEIADECQMSKEEVERYLQDLIAAGLVVKRTRGGIHNRGRRMKFHYELSPEKIKNPR